MLQQPPSRGVARAPADATTRAPKAEGFLRAWAKEDVYFTLDREVELLQDAGFAVEMAFREDCFAVVVGLK